MIENLADDLIVGAEAIGKEIGKNYRQTHRMLELKHPPLEHAFQIGSIWHIRRSRLHASILKLEGEAA